MIIVLQQDFLRRLTKIKVPTNALPQRQAFTASAWLVDPLGNKCMYAPPMARWSQGPSLNQRMLDTRGHTRGFDYLRFCLASLVLCWHGVKAVDGPAAERTVLSGPLHGAISLLLPMFFALSGFLVCASLERSRGLVPFVVHRFLRIVPALTVVILLSAFVLGPLMTTLTMAQYFSHAAFYQYLSNIVGFSQFQLPGVFLNTPEPRTVNASLWTIRYELGCYMALALLASLGLLKQVRVLFAVIILSWIVCTALLFWRGSVRVAMESGTSGHFLVVCFLAGTVIFLLRDKVRMPGSVMLVMLAVLSYGLLSRPELAFLAPFPVAYLTVCLGLLNPPRIPVFSDGDYSYGLYLIAFPIQQTYSALFPHQRTWGRDVIISMALSLCYAFLSWHLVEKPIIKRRKRIVASVQAALSHFSVKIKPSSLARLHPVAKNAGISNPVARLDDAPL